MGLNLTLIPQTETAGTIPGPWLAFARLPLRTQNRELFQRIERIAHPFTDGVWWYGDEGLKQFSTDPYDTPLTYVLARDLKVELECADMVGTDAAIRAFVAAMPPDWRVVLWWC